MRERETDVGRPKGVRLTIQILGCVLAAAVLTAAAVLIARFVL